MTIRALLAALMLLAAAPAVIPAATQPAWPDLREGDLVLKDFAFASGEILPELKLHYRTLGTEKRNAAGEIINGMVLLHGTSDPDESRHMDVMAAGMHDVDFAAFVILGGDLTRVGEAGLFLHGQCIHVGANHDRAAAAVLHDADDAIAF